MKAGLQGEREKGGREKGRKGRKREEKEEKCFSGKTEERRSKVRCSGEITGAGKQEVSKWCDAPLLPRATIKQLPHLLPVLGGARGQRHRESPCRGWKSVYPMRD